MTFTETQAPIIDDANSEELAYVLLEEARLRCRALLEEERDSSDDSGLVTIEDLYCDLGIAGYYVSARLEPNRRRELLAHARARSRLRNDPNHPSGEPVLELTDVTAAATRSVERALAVTGLLDHIHLAHVHVMSACETLDALFALQA